MTTVGDSLVKQVGDAKTALTVCDPSMEEKVSHITQELLEAVNALCTKVTHLHFVCAVYVCYYERITGKSLQLPILDCITSRICHVYYSRRQN